MLATDQETKTLKNKAEEEEEECGESQGSLLGSNLTWGPRQPWEVLTPGGAPLLAQGLSEDSTGSEGRDASGALTPATPRH